MRPAIIMPVILFAVLVAEAQENTAAAVSPASRILRALGLESPPGARGDRAYRKGDYEEALRQYGKAAEETPPTSPERPLLDKNIGNALYRQKRPAEAIDYYERALKGSGRDSQFAGRVHHNLGNAFYRKAETADSAEMQEAIADLREAVAHYKKSLQKTPGDRNAKQNLEMANARLQQLLERQQQQQQQQQGKPPEPSPKAKEALARALQLTQERRYEDATKVLDGILRSDPTAASFAAHRQRLDDVVKILRGEKPSDPAPKDPRATPWKAGPPGRGMP
jgi:tetratricopeptide (TPR) repeat protein